MEKETCKYRKQLVKNFIDWWGTIPRDRLKLSDILQVISNTSTTIESTNLEECVECQ